MTSIPRCHILGWPWEVSMLARDTTVQEVLHTLTPVEQAALVKSFFASFPASARDQLLAEALRVEIPAGTVWYREADEPQRVSLVVSGLLRLYLAAPDGRQLTVRYARSGDALGIATSAGGPGILTKQVVTDCALLVFRRPTLLALGQRDVRVAWAIAEEITHRLFVYPGICSISPAVTSRAPPSSHPSASRNWPMPSARCGRWSLARSGSCGTRGSWRPIRRGFSSTIRSGLLGETWSQTP
jgi:hypothetical protein